MQFYFSEGVRINPFCFNQHLFCQIFFCLVYSLPNKSANSVSLVPYLHISKISTTGLLPAYFSKFLKIFFSIFFKIYQIHLRLMHKACVSYAWNLTEIYVLDDPEICLRIAEDTYLRFFWDGLYIRDVLSFWPFWMKFSLFWCKYDISNSTNLDFLPNLRWSPPSLQN